MSIWKKLESKILESNVNERLLREALGDLNISLDTKIKTIRNSYGEDSVDAGFVYNKRPVSLGIRYNKNKGIELIGDIFNTGLGRDGKQEGLLNKIAQSYQKRHIINRLETNGWTVESIEVKEEKIIIDAVQF